MAIVERSVDQPRDTATRFRAYIPGRVLPHAAMVTYLLYFLSGSISLVREMLWLFVFAYVLLLLAHTLAAARRIRFPIVAGGTAGFALLLGMLAPMLAPHSEAGSYVAGVLAFFVIVLACFSCVNNYWFVAWRGWYFAELVIINGVWAGVASTSLDVSTAAMIGLTLPVVAYSLYVLLYDYTFGRRLASDGKRALTLRWLAALLVLLIVALLGSLAGASSDPPGASGAYSLLSKKNDRFQVQERAKLEDELRIPLDAKELVFVANVDPTRLNGANIGAPYLKFHSLYSYDPGRMEFNMAADEFESPAFRVRRVSIDHTKQEPVALTLDADGRAMLPSYALRFDATSTIYNVKLSTEESFGHNLTYRFISYPASDSITVAEKTLPLLGTYRLFNKISALNVIPIGTAGQFFQFDLNKLVLDRVAQYQDIESAPRAFTQRYLNTTGLEQDIVDTALSLLRGKRDLRERIMTVLNFFTQKGADGQNLFVYSLKPGKSPDPQESLLHYFLLRSHRGYCTYYATAATLFFRLAGIPARVAVGFTPGEESEQNPGWFFVYSNQAHAWTEIYLGPTLGWIDVDLTPAGSGPPSPPPPPPTPPVPPTPIEAQLALSGVVVETGDSLSLRDARLRLTSEARDTVLRAFPRTQPVRLRFDATIEHGGVPSKERAAATDIIRSLHAGDSVIASGSRAANEACERGTANVFRFTKLSRAQRVEKDSTHNVAKTLAQSSWWKRPLPWIAAGLVLLLLLFLFPTLHLVVLARRSARARDAKRQLSAARDWLLLALHLQHLAPERETDLEFAHRAGAQLGIDLSVFIERYLHARYSDAAGVDCGRECAAMMTDVRAALLRMGRVRCIVRRFNLWEYVRFINRRKTA